MSRRMVAKKLAVCSDLGVIEKTVAIAVIDVTMKRCTFRDEQIKKLIGD